VLGAALDQSSRGFESVEDLVRATVRSRRSEHEVLQSDAPERGEQEVHVWIVFGQFQRPREKRSHHLRVPRDHFAQGRVVLRLDDQTEQHSGPLAILGESTCKRECACAPAIVMECRARLGDEHPEVFREHLDEPLCDGSDQVELPREVVREMALRHARSARDLRLREVFHAGLAQHANRRVQDLFADTAGMPSHRAVDCWADVGCVKTYGTAAALRRAIVPRQTCTMLRVRTLASRTNTASRTLRASIAASLFLPCACGRSTGPDGGADAGGLPACTPPATPLRLPDDSLVCATLGAQELSCDGDYSDIADLRGQLAYVRSGAAPGGDGTRDRAFATIEQAVASTPRPDVILLSRGTHTILGTIAFTNGVEIRGCGASLDGSIVRFPSQEPAFDFRNGRTNARIMRTRLVAARDTRFATVPAVRVSDESTLWLREVTIEDAGVGLAVQHATIDVQRVTVLRPATIGFVVGPNADAILTGFRVDGAGAQGVSARASHLTIHGGSIIGSGREGIVMHGNDRGDSEVTDLALQRNTGAGLRLEDGAVAAVNDTYVTDTVAAPDGEGGDGFVVVQGASLVLDSATEGVRRMTFGVSARNARSGVFAAGTGVRVELHHTVIASNGGVGVWLGDGALARVIDTCLIEDSGGAGVACVGSAAVARMNGTTIRHTRSVEFRAAARAVRIGDALHLNAPPIAIELADNVLEDSAGFAGVLFRSAGTASANRGRRNRYGLVAYESTFTVDASNQVEGTDGSAPAATPPLLDATMSPTPH